jgi:hypothetical protein
MASTLAVASAVTKIGYQDLHEQLDKRIVALQMVKSGSKSITFGGKEAQFAIHTGRNQGVGARNEDEDLPEAGQNRDAVAHLFLKYQYGSISGSGQVFEQVETNIQAYVDWMQREVNTMTESLERDLNRQVYGDGSGTLATLTTAASATTSLVVDDAHFLEEDMFIDVLTQATLGNPTPTKGNTAKLTIVSVDTTTNTVVVSGGTVTAAVGSVLVRAGTNYNNWKKEWEGFGLQISTTSVLHGIDPATEPKWKAGYVETGVGTLAELDITHLVQGIDKKGGKITDLLTSYGVANAYWNILQGLRQYQGATRLGTNAETPTYQGITGQIPLTLDWACPTGTIYGINKGEMFLHQRHDWKWMDRTGTMWQQVAGKDRYTATMYKYSNIGITRRNSFGKLTGITEA